MLVMKQTISLLPFCWGRWEGIQQIGMKKDRTNIFNSVGKVTTVLAVKMSTLLFGLLEFCSLQTDHVN
jgi:hypothetical protein